MCTSMFTAVLGTIVKLQKQPKRLATDEWIKKQWYRGQKITVGREFALHVAGLARFHCWHPIWFPKSARNNS